MNVPFIPDVQFPSSKPLTPYTQSNFYMVLFRTRDKMLASILMKEKKD